MLLQASADRRSRSNCTESGKRFAALACQPRGSLPRQWSTLPYPGAAAALRPLELRQSSRAQHCFLMLRASKLPTSPCVGLVHFALKSLQFATAFNTTEYIRVQIFSRSFHELVVPPHCRGAVTGVFSLGMWRSPQPNPLSRLFTDSLQP